MTKRFLCIIPLIIIIFVVASPLFCYADTIYENANISALKYDFTIYLRDKYRPDEYPVQIDTQTNQNFGTIYSPQISTAQDYIVNQCDFWLYFGSVNLPDGLDDLKFTYSMYLFIDTSGGNMGNTSSYNLVNYTYGAENLRVEQVQNINDAGNFPFQSQGSTYTQAHFYDFCNSIYKITFDFYAKSGVSLVCSAFSNNYYSTIAYCAYDQTLIYSYTDVYDRITGGIQNIDEQLDNVEQTLDDIEYGVQQTVLAINSQTSSINNKIQAQTTRVVNTLNANFDVLVDDYLDYQYEMSSGVSYADYVEGLIDNSNDTLQDVADYEDSINAYLDTASINGMYQTITSMFPTYVQGLTFWGQTFDRLGIYGAPWAQMLIYCSFAIGLIGSVSGIVFAFRRGIERREHNDRGDKE